MDNSVKKVKKITPLGQVCECGILGNPSSAFLDVVVLTYYRDEQIIR
jgi:hypothetical protein